MNIFYYLVAGLIAFTIIRFLIERFDSVKIDPKREIELTNSYRE